MDFTVCLQLCRILLQTKLHHLYNALIMLQLGVSKMLDFSACREMLILPGPIHYHRMWAMQCILMRYKLNGCILISGYLGLGFRLGNQFCCNSVIDSKL